MCNMRTIVRDGIFRLDARTTSTPWRLCLPQVCYIFIFNSVKIIACGYIRYMYRDVITVAGWDVCCACSNVFIILRSRNCTFVYRISALLNNLIAISSQRCQEAGHCEYYSLYLVHSRVLLIYFIITFLPSLI